MRVFAGRRIWANRGRSWGFRFLLDGGLSDPLLKYEGIFADLGDESTAWRRVAGKVALRFPDPRGWRDAAGRVIPHEFVVSGDLARDIHSAEEGLQQVWPAVKHAYARVWRVLRIRPQLQMSASIQDDTPLDALRSANGDADNNHD